ncbi:hypothetical protein F4803DRAFT_511136 [Xylaria telfairii]|nr:hypothetical protein F4803DRAFT_511136 [Xylaria telfairii]
MFANALPLALLVGAAMASPAKSSTAAIAPGDAFGIIAIHSGTDIHFASLEAADLSFFLNPPSENTCGTFTLAEDGSLDLYRTTGPVQKAYVDRSQFGHGKFGYTIGGTPPPRDAERTEFIIDESGHITFNGESFLACRNGTDISWSVWVDVGGPNPDGYETCLAFVGRTIEIENPDPTNCNWTP